MTRGHLLLTMSHAFLTRGHLFLTGGHLFLEGSFEPLSNPFGFGLPRELGQTNSRILG
jgi:hypothetical protein